MNADENRVITTISIWVAPRDASYIATRISGRGRQEYGPLNIDDDAREYLSEACEELADAVWYLACEVERRRREGHEYGRVALLGHFVGMCWRALKALDDWDN